MVKPYVATPEDHWLVDRAVEVNRDDLVIVLSDHAWEASGDAAFDALTRLAKQAGLGCYW